MRGNTSSDSVRHWRHTRVPSKKGTSNVGVWAHDEGSALPRMGTSKAFRRRGQVENELRVLQVDPRHISTTAPLVRDAPSRGSDKEYYAIARHGVWYRLGEKLRAGGRAGGGSRRRLPQTVCVYAHAPDATLVKESNGRAAYYIIVRGRGDVGGRASPIPP